MSKRCLWPARPRTCSTEGMNKPTRTPISAPPPAKRPSSTSLKITVRHSPPRVEGAVLRDRHAVHERTFVNAPRSTDAVAEEMGENAVRAFTSGEDETEAERGDGGGELTLEDVDFVSEETARASQP